MQSKGDLTISCSCRLNEVFKRGLLASRIPEEYWGASNNLIGTSAVLYEERLPANESKTKKEQSLSYSTKKIDINKFIDNIVKIILSGGSESPNVLLFGAYGAGKTHIACAIGMAVIPNMRVRFSTSIHLGDLMHSIKRGSFSQMESVIDEYTDLGCADLLIIDDLGFETSTGDLSDAVFGGMRSLIRQRIGKTTIITTQNSPDGIISHYKNEMMSVFDGYYYKVNVVSGVDHRIVRGKKMVAALDREVFVDA